MIYPGSDVSIAHEMPKERAALFYYFIFSITKCPLYVLFQSPTSAATTLLWKGLFSSPPKLLRGRAPRELCLQRPGLVWGLLVRV